MDWLRGILRENRTETSSPPYWRAAFMVLLGAAVFGWLLRDAPLLGWDWFHTIRIGGDIDVWYPGWTKLLTRPLAGLPWRWGLAFSNGLMLAGVAIATYLQRRDRWSALGAVLAVLSPPVLVLLWAGNVDGWALLGYLTLPWGVPLLMIKPTIGAFVLLTRRSWFIAGLVFTALTLLVWGWWPAQAIGMHVTGGNIHTSSSMGWYILGWPIGALGVLLMLFTDRKSPWHMMAAGSFLMPYVFPYHFILLLPALGRWGGLRQVLVWLAAWTLFGSFIFGYAATWVGYLFPLVVWLFIFEETPRSQTWLAEVQRLWRTSKA
ncbi:MAG: hypothetical protein KF701_04500 [Anaerolineales bacterium]|nr:MAG: hypothetical protein KF701_04500 [Anaerolineales bacterium]